MQWTQMEGTHDAGQVKLFALSTCGWCRKTRQMFDEHKLKYQYVYVDLLQGADREEAMTELRKHTSRQGFPTTIVNDEVIIGFDEDKLRKALKL